jgi:hypothetical protein
MQSLDDDAGEPDETGDQAHDAAHALPDEERIN